MKNFLFAPLFLFVFTSVFSQKYPVTKIVPNLNTKFNISYQDDYSWLENMDSEEIKSWANAQNETTNTHLEEVKKNMILLEKLMSMILMPPIVFPIKKKHTFIPNTLLIRVNRVCCFTEKS